MANKQAMELDTKGFDGSGSGTGATGGAAPKVRPKAQPKPKAASIVVELPRTVRFSADTAAPSDPLPPFANHNVGGFIDPTAPATDLDAFFGTTKARRVMAARAAAAAAGSGGGSSGSSSGSAQPLAKPSKFKQQIAEAKRSAAAGAASAAAGGGNAWSAMAYARTPNAPAFSHLLYPSPSAQPSKALAAAAAAAATPMPSTRESSQAELRKRGLLLQPKELPNSQVAIAALAAAALNPNAVATAATTLAPSTGAASAASSISTAGGSGGNSSSGGGFASHEPLSLASLELALAATLQAAADTEVLARLPDGGSKLKLKIADLQRRITAKRADAERELTTLLTRMTLTQPTAATATPPTATPANPADLSEALAAVKRQFAPSREAQRRARSEVDVGARAAAMAVEHERGVTGKFLSPLPMLSLDEASKLERSQTILQREMAAQAMRAAAAASAKSVVAPAGPGAGGAVGVDRSIAMVLASASTSAMQGVDDFDFDLTDRKGTSARTGGAGNASVAGGVDSDGDEPGDDGGGGGGGGDYGGDDDDEYAPPLDLPEFGRGGAGSSGVGAVAARSAAMDSDGEGDGGRDGNGDGDGDGEYDEDRLAHSPVTVDRDDTVD